MEKQTSFSEWEYNGKKKQTRRDLFLGKMETLVPWQEWIALIEPHYPKGERGRPPIGMRTDASPVSAAGLVQFIG